MGSIILNPLTPILVRLRHVQGLRRQIRLMQEKRILWSWESVVTKPLPPFQQLLSQSSINYHRISIMLIQESHLYYQLSFRTQLARWRRKGYFEYSETLRQLLGDILLTKKEIDPSICIHKILIVENFKSSMDGQ